MGRMPPELKLPEFVYFMATADKSRIRIGYTGAGDRIGDHKRYGHVTLAVIPATKTNENSLHNYFSKWPRPYEGDTSHYDYDAVFPYVERLLSHHYAGKEDQIRFLSKVPWKLWSPTEISKPIMHGDQQLLFMTEALRAEARDTWQTPAYIADLCRDVMEGIDLDPASCYEANLRVKAEFFYTEDRDGLKLPWHGRVFLNPPYGGAKECGADLFLRKLIDELHRGNATQAITVLNLQSVPTLWFPRVRRAASAHAIWSKRINFIGPVTKSGHTKYGAAKNGTIFSYFGPHRDRFIEVFSSGSMAFIEFNK